MVKFTVNPAHPFARRESTEIADSFDPGKQYYKKLHEFPDPITFGLFTLARISQLLFFRPPIASLSANTNSTGALRLK